MFAYMRNSDGTPRTPRKPNGDLYTNATVSCPNGVVKSNFAFPSSNTIQFFVERGHSVAKLVTPRVLEFVREHFGCDSLNGAELEDNEYGCFGSHWEERIFESEIMSAVSSTHNVVSGLTLAYFDDSGWYKSNPQAAQPLNWGAKRGCEFATSSCVDRSTGEPIDSDHFCTAASSTNLGCTVDGFSKALCSYKAMAGAEIPFYYQYFASSNAGGLPYMDYCPIYDGYAQGSCADPSNLFSPPGTNLNILGETFGENSRCAKSTLHNEQGSQWEISQTGAGCYEMSCKDGVIEISIPYSESSTKQVQCEQQGQQVFVDGFGGRLYCPDPYLICNHQRACAIGKDCGKNAICIQGQCTCLSGYVPNNGKCESACPNDCSANGFCNTSTRTCSCNGGYKGADCSEVDGGYVEPSANTNKDNATTLVCPSTKFLLMVLLSSLIM